MPIHSFHIPRCVASTTTALNRPTDQPETHNLTVAAAVSARPAAINIVFALVENLIRACWCKGTLNASRTAARHATWTAGGWQNHKRGRCFNLVSTHCCLDVRTACCCHHFYSDFIPNLSLSSTTIKRPRGVIDCTFRSVKEQPSPGMLAITCGGHLRGANRESLDRRRLGFC